MNRSTMSAASLALLALSACGASDPAREPTGRAGPATSAAAVSSANAVSAPAAATQTRAARSLVAKAEDDPCGATQVKGWISATPTVETKAQIAHTVGKRTIRYHTEGDILATDYDASRLNGVFAKSGRIAQFRCG